MNYVDQKWLDALKAIYPVEGAALPYWTASDGMVDAVQTLQKVLALAGVKFDTDGRIAAAQ